MCHNYEGMNDLSELQLTCVNFFRYLGYEYCSIHSFLYIKHL